jgi:simple sugar transport system substrate-binding protein
MMYQNVPVPAAVNKVGGGYVGAQLAPQGHALGVEILRRSGLKSGDLAIVILASNDELRNVREESSLSDSADADKSTIDSWHRYVPEAASMMGVFAHIAA